MTLMYATAVDHPPETAERRVAIVTGDRLCTNCGYNLIGQLVTREEHYDMLIVRCPECAAVAGVHEYPLLGRWANRWGVVLAILWFIFLLAMWPGTSSAVFGMGMGSAYTAAYFYGDHIESLRQQTEQQQTQQVQAGGRTITYSFYGSGFASWWEAQDKDAILAGAGGWLGATSWIPLLLMWIPTSLVVFVVGWFWAVALIQFRRRWLIVWGVAVMGLALAFGAIPLAVIHFEGARWHDDAAMQQIGAQNFLLTMAASLPALALGLAYGRSVTRGLVRALLPPRLRGALSLLWTADGLGPPRTASAR